jgi:metallo-beta-lactamase family protein
MRLTFLGATGTVTGSRYLVTHDGRRVLVDCGLFQGLKSLRLRNWAPLPVDPASIDAVVLTHAHLDHSGWLPRLVAQGFRGRVHATGGTADLCRILLPDAARLQEEEADFANRHGFSKHAPALPLYTEADARRALDRLCPSDAQDDVEPVPGVHLRFTPAGHILGAASVRVEAAGRSILFSGDLGRRDDLVMRPPVTPAAADTVLVESTYGDRLHGDADPVAQLGEVVSRTAARGGVVVVPAFAVGRAQALLHALALLKARQAIPDLPIFLNSPMATEVTHLLDRRLDELKLSREDLQRLHHAVRIVTTEEQSRALNQLHMPAVIVSASGMATGGRVLHHLAAYAPDPRHTILLAGYQAAGTRGASLQAGAREIRIHGAWVPVRAEVCRLDGLSAHADRQGLLDWLAALPSAPERVFVTHGEPEAADRLRQAIEERFRWACRVPEYLEEVEA